MKLKRLLWSAILILAIVPTAFGGIRPSFRLDHSAWKATHIVIAVTTATDGRFEVVESLKGDLHVGARLAIPDLRPSDGAEPIVSSLESPESVLCHPGSRLIPKQPVGSRVILFLVGGTHEPVSQGKAEVEEWKPSDWGIRLMCVLAMRGIFCSDFVTKNPSCRAVMAASTSAPPKATSGLTVVQLDRVGLARLTAKQADYWRSGKN
jgi:hypothetical protein